MMRAVVVNSFGPFTQAHEALVPRPIPKPGEVLVEMESAVISNFDYGLMAGIHGRDYVLPLIPGIEGAGTVIECGDGMEGLAQKRVNVLGLHTFAEYTVAKVKELIPMLDELTFDQGAVLVGNPATVTMMRDTIKASHHLAAMQSAANSAVGQMISVSASKTAFP